jgi:hypothetical protein
MGMLPKLVAAYIEIDRLITISPVRCSSAIEAIDYLIKFNNASYCTGANRIQTSKTIAAWTKYMEYVQQQLVFSPNYTQWDKHTREIESLAQKALSESEKVIEAHNAPAKRLPEEVFEGIIIRTKVLQGWRRDRLEPIRARDDYKDWKEKQSASVTQKSQRKLRAGLIVSNRF